MRTIMLLAALATLGCAPVSGAGGSAVGVGWCELYTNDPGPPFMAHTSWVARCDPGERADRAALRMWSGVGSHLRVEWGVYWSSGSAAEYSGGDTLTPPRWTWGERAVSAEGLQRNLGCNTDGVYEAISADGSRVESEFSCGWIAAPSASEIEAATAACDDPDGGCWFAATPG